MTEATSIRIFVVDDHPVVREGFRKLLEQMEPFAVAGEASSGTEALETIPEVDVDLALVDISMEGMSGIELTRRLKEQYADLQVLIVSVHNETQYVNDALDAGANGYVLKDNVPAQLTEAVREVMRGEIYVCDELNGKINSDG